MDISQLVVGGAAFGFLASIWGYVKTVAWKCCNLLIRQVEIHEEITANAVVGYLIDNYRKSDLYEKAYTGSTEYVRQASRSGLIAYEIYGKRSMIFWNKIFPFIFAGPEKTPTDKSGSPYGGSTSTPQVKATITYLRWTLDVEKIVEQAVYERNSRTWDAESKRDTHRRRFFIKYIPDISKDSNAQSSGASTAWYSQNHVRLIGYKVEDLGRGKDEGVNMLDNLIFPKRVRDLIEEVKLWRKNRDWYQKRSIPWKRGWLLYGPPGTGKTALARAFAEDLDLPIFVFNLAEVGNFEFMRSWISMQQSTPCIALIEDIDNVFNGRDNVTTGRRGLWSLALRPKKDKGDEKEEVSGGLLNFDVFINCLDGVERSEGVFTIITTNDITKVDPALGQPQRNEDGSIEFISTRPGRIDKAIELTYMEQTEKRIMARRILAEYQDAMEDMLTYIDNHPDALETPAQFQERCAQIALARFWREQHPELFANEPPAYVLVDNDAARRPNPAAADWKRVAANVAAEKALEELDDDDDKWAGLEDEE